MAMAVEETVLCRFRRRTEIGSDHRSDLCDTGKDRKVRPTNEAESVSDFLPITCLHEVWLVGTTGVEYGWRRHTGFRVSGIKKAAGWFGSQEHHHHHHHHDSSLKSILRGARLRHRRRLIVGKLAGNCAFLVRECKPCRRCAISRRRHRRLSSAFEDLDDDVIGCMVIAVRWLDGDENEI
ncbi:hypothetical protein ZHAS_00009082 [Anopheles sinensis]|uniref:Uncharacterized protein n=1 Tax=Anopheles sinensis TaxID=74873 RepID=A0A084VU44_ANOSI|nr:hypothetical protein ZHAS_00009082 [Anopheles sinensis]